MATKTTETTRRRRATTPKRKTAATRTVNSGRFDDLNAAIAAWNRLAIPAVDPDTCTNGLPWCVDCCNAPATNFDTATVFHHSATATVNATTYNGGFDDAEREVEVIVERFDVEGEVSCPTYVWLHLGTRDRLYLTAVGARDLATALHGASAATMGLLDRGGDADTTDAVSTVRIDGFTFQVGAVLTGDLDERAVTVFINCTEVVDAGMTRRIVNDGRGAHPKPASWDFPPQSARDLAARLTAAADLVDADRRASAAPICPSWCAKHLTDPDGSVCHEGPVVEVAVAGDETLVGGVVTLKLTRFDEPGRIGTVAVCLQSSQDGIDLSPAELRTVAAIAEQLAVQTEVTR